MANLTNTRGLLGTGKYTKVRTFKAGGTIVAGRTVALDIVGATGEDRCVEVLEGTATVATSNCIVGVALEAASAGDDVRVAVAGYVEGVLTDGNVTIGMHLMAAAGGALIPYLNDSAVDARPIGFALETDSGTTCDVFLFDLFPDFQ